MTDKSAEAPALIDMLRERAASYRIGGPSSEHTARMLDEAADTITRLTAEVERLKSDNELRDINGHNDALKAEYFEKGRATLTAEVERLRTALADAGRALDGAARKMKGNCSSGDVAAVMLAAGRTAEARAALKEEKTDD